MRRDTKNLSVTPGQIKALHASFHRLKFDDDARHDFIESYTNGRTCHTNELTFDEARDILKKFYDDVSKAVTSEAKALCRAIYKLSFDIPSLNQGYTSDTEEDFQMNIAKINSFCRTRTKARKNMNRMDIEELRALKKQFEAIARKGDKA